MEVIQIEDRVQLEKLSEPRPILSRLVNYEPLSNTHLKFKPFPLSELSTTEQIRDQEALVVRDLLNVLMGLDGSYIRYNNSFNPISGDIPEFRIAKKMDSSLKALCSRVVKLGKQYFFLCKCFEKWCDLRYGMTLQRLGYEIRQFIQLDYLRFVESLERQFNENATFSIREFIQNIKDTEVIKQLELLYTICHKIEKEMYLRSNADLLEEDFNNFINDLRDELQYKEDIMLATDTSLLPIAKGGIILKIVQKSISENLGDRSSVTFLKSLINNISQNYCQILHEWLTQGLLNDPYDEFMICDAMKNVDTSIANLKFDDRLWFTQYRIRKDGLLPRFESREGNELLFKVLMTGKLLNIIRISYDINELPMNVNNGDIIPNFVELLEGTNLELYVNQWYNRANELCFKLYFDGYDLHSFLQSLQMQYFGYHNGHGILKFLQRNIVDLARNYKGDTTSIENKLFQIFLSERKNSSNHNTSMQFLTLGFDKQPFNEVILQYVQQDISRLNGTPDDDNSEEILHAPNFNNLRSILLNEINHSPSTKTQVKSNIYYLQFNMRVPYPLNIIVNRTCIDQFQIISRYIYLLQYHCKLLDDIWFEVNKNKLWRYRGYSPDVQRNVIRKSRVLHSKMNNFFKNVLQYFTQNVVEREASLMLSLRNSPKYINDFQNLIQECLTNIMTNCCLSQLMEIQLQMFDIAHKFCKFIITLRSKLNQVDPRLQYRSNDYSQEESNTPGYDEDETLKLTSDLSGYINVVYTGFDQHVQAFMEGLHHFYDNRTRLRIREDRNGLGG